MKLLIYYVKYHTFLAYLVCINTYDLLKMEDQNALYETTRTLR